MTFAKPAPICSATMPTTALTQARGEFRRDRRTAGDGGQARRDDHQDDADQDGDRRMQHAQSDQQM